MISYVKYFLILFATLILQTVFCQVEAGKDWCRIDCDPNIHKENVALIYDAIANESIMTELANLDSVRFPIRFVYIEEKEKTVTDSEKIKEVEEVIRNLNTEFRTTKFVFYTDKILSLVSQLKLEDLAGNVGNLYDDFSKQHDLENTITVFILDHKSDFCRVTETSISCSRTGGFSYILSGRTNNIVLSNFDLRNSKIVAHEFGHFFGLYHTFEEFLFGKDDFNPNDCTKQGDLICDTPPDPGTVFEIYVNYFTCEMLDLKDPLGNEYKPLLQNIMSYYKPCYLKENTFTKQQQLVMQVASQLEMRSKFSR